jgi:hypothetical protein
MSLRCNDFLVWLERYCDHSTTCLDLIRPFRIALVKKALLLGTESPARLPKARAALVDSLRIRHTRPRTYCCAMPRASHSLGPSSHCPFESQRPALPASLPSHPLHLLRQEPHGLSAIFSLATATRLGPQGLCVPKPVLGPHMKINLPHKAFPTLFGHEYGGVPDTRVAPTKLYHPSTARRASVLKQLLHLTNN